MVKITAEIVEGDIEEDLAALILGLCGIDYTDFLANNRILTEDIFEKNFSKIISELKFHPYQRIADIILGYFILITGCKLPSFLKDRVLKAADWSNEDGLWEKDLENERKFYLRDFQMKMQNHRDGKVSHLVSLKNSGNMDFSIWIVGVEEFWKAINNKKIYYVKHINLDGCGLSSIPSFVFNLKYLETLSVEHNNLVEIPEIISEMVSLEGLFLDYNYLKRLPSSIGRLKKLRELYLNNNFLKSIPETIKDLPSLKEIHLRNNKIKSIPDFLKSSDLFIDI